jgi:hypothetical protein
MDRVARFFLARDTKTSKNVPNERKMYQMIIEYSKCPQIIPNGHKIHKPIFYKLRPSKIYPNSDFWLKIIHLATLQMDTADTFHCSVFNNRFLINIFL